MKKVLLPLAIAMFSVIGLNAQTAPAKGTTPVGTPATPPANPNAAVFKFESDTFNFGKIKQGETVSHEYKFKNVGKEPLLISDASATCGCTKPSFSKDPIKPKGTGVISVTFNSTGKMGYQDKVITITSNAKDGQKMIHLKGTVEPKPVEAAPPATPPAATPVAPPAKTPAATQPK